MEPQFKSALVTHNSDKSTNKAYIIVSVCVLACLVFAGLKLYHYSTVSFVLAMLTIVVILVMKKGRIQAYMISQRPFLLTPDSIKINNTTYRINEVTDLVLTIHSYNGMNDPSGSESFNGMRNNISFKYRGAEEYHWFYLRNRQHAIELCAVLREYYRKKIPCTEKDMYGQRTWLMQRLENMKEVEEFKKRHKIP